MSWLGNAADQHRLKRIKIVCKELPSLSAPEDSGRIGRGEVSRDKNEIFNDVE